MQNFSIDFDLYKESGVPRFFFEKKRVVKAGAF